MREHARTTLYTDEHEQPSCDPSGSGSVEGGRAAPAQVIDESRREPSEKNLTGIETLTFTWKLKGASKGMSDVIASVR